MLILGINSATARTAITLADLDKSGVSKPRILFSKSWDSNRDEAEKILPAVQAALKSLKRKSLKKKALKNDKPDLIFVVRGPGSFTGLRIGVTIANMLASVLKIKMISADTFEYLRARVPVLMRKKTAIILKAGGEFVAVLVPGKKTPLRLHKSELEGFFMKHRSVKFAAGDMSAEENRSFALPKGVKWLEEKRLAGIADVIAELLVKNGANKMRSQKMISPKYLLPPKITKSKKPAFTR
jgi:tRNA threonylcarbamoyl adenosine modification protein YeaZ